MSKPALKGRVVIRSDIVLDLFGEPTKGWRTPYAYDVASEETAYERTVWVGEDWQWVDLGWVKEPSLLYLCNVPTKFSKQPSEEDRAEAETKVIEVGTMEDNRPFALIRPGRDMQFEPSSPQVVKVRCPKGRVKMQIVSIPR